jgi:hypothetical protein
MTAARSVDRPSTPTVAPLSTVKRGSMIFSDAEFHDFMNV